MQRQVRKAVLVCFAVIAGSAAINLLSHPPDGLHALAAEIMINTKSGPSGDYLVDGDGNSLYVFEKDTPSTSTCTGDCALLWPPLVSAEGDTVGVGGGAQGNRLSPNPFVRPDGGRQVVYADHPLYAYAKDRQPGDTSGNNVDSFGGKWCLLSPAGFTLCNNAATGTPGGGGGGGGGVVPAVNPSVSPRVSPSPNPSSSPSPVQSKSKYWTQHGSIGAPEPACRIRL